MLKKCATLFIAISCIVSPLAWCLSFFASDTTRKSPSGTLDSTGQEAKYDSTQAPRYEKREFDHQQQVVVGGVVMLCVALALVGMNNYNPRR